VAAALLTGGLLIGMVYFLPLAFAVKSAIRRRKPP